MGHPSALYRAEIIQLSNNGGYKCMEEVWKDIGGFEGLYQVSSHGNVRSLERTGKKTQLRGRLLKKTIHRNKGLESNSTPYERVSLSLGGVFYGVKVHRLVATAFLEHDDVRNQVNHKDGNGLNNHLDNLEWCTGRENVQHSWRELGRTPRPGLKDAASKKIKQINSVGETVKIWDSANQAGREAGFNHNGISHVLTGRQSTHKGYRWEYA
jgi:hypothetical protein